MHDVTFDRLRVEKCNETAWQEVLKILEDTEQSDWFSGKEKYQDFYTITDTDLNKIIACFTFYQSGTTGILQNFAVCKNLQRKGIGTFIANNLIPEAAREKGIKKLFLHGNDRGIFTSNHFWIKTIFKPIKSSEVKDPFYLDYFNHLVNDYPPESLCKESIFYLDIN